MQEQFGLFIHWGLYSLTAYHEQVRARLMLGRADYGQLAAVFNPQAFDPASWCRLAKSAGMSYICFTAKHHDGFCLWDTAATDFNVMNTPLGQDVLAQLAKACQSYGLRLSIYYSLPDWNQPNAYNPASSHQCPPEAGDEPDSLLYREFVKKQLTELLTRYGPVYTLFWDIPPQIHDPSLNQYARSLQPQIMINDRGYDPGDFATPERQVPPGLWFSSPTEACQSVDRQSWGWRLPEDYYTAPYLKSSLARIMAMGGSYLLNAGPDQDGRIAPGAARLIEQCGDWYIRVKAAFGGTSPLPRLMADASPQQPFLALANEEAVYLVFPDSLVSSSLILKSIQQKPSRVRLLNDGRELDFTVTTSPLLWSWDKKSLAPPCLHLFQLPADEFAHEPLVIQID